MANQLLGVPQTHVIYCMSGHTFSGVSCALRVPSESNNLHMQQCCCSLAVHVVAAICVKLSSNGVHNIEWVVKVQTIKTSVESAIMLLRIDDIVSGISKKSRGGGGQPSGTQTEDHDNVSISVISLLSPALWHVHTCMEVATEAICSLFHEHRRQYTKDRWHTPCRDAHKCVPCRWSLSKCCRTRTSSYNE